MKIFFAGIIQGSKQGEYIHSQNYRDEVKSFLISHCPGCEVFDPVDGHEESVYYNDDRAREVFFGHLGIVQSCDLLIAFLPEASMGTAIEMFEAYTNDIPILTISPMTSNWVVRLLSYRNFETVSALEKFVTDNDIAVVIDEYREATVKESV
jgi:hypothetical protein